MIPLLSSTDPVIKPLNLPHTLSILSRGRIFLTQMSLMSHQQKLMQNILPCIVVVFYLNSSNMSHQLMNHINVSKYIYYRQDDVRFAIAHQIESRVAMSKDPDSPIQG